MLCNNFQSFVSEQKTINNKLDEIGLKIKNNEYSSELRRVRAFGGADVIVSNEFSPENERWVNDQHFVISPQSTAPRKRLVITPYAIELSWLFHQLADVFHEQIDFINKYDFYGLLAQNALDFIENNNNEYDCNSLLIYVLDESRNFLKIN